MKRLLACTCGLLLACSAAAEIYQWTDAGGNRHFGDRPPRDTAHETVKLRDINTFQSVSTAELPAWARDAADGREVVIYTAGWCGVCKQATQYFRDAGIPYREYDIEKSNRGQRDFARLKARGVPVILVGGKRMNGFSRQRFRSLYDR